MWNITGYGYVFVSKYMKWVAHQQGKNAIRNKFHELDGNCTIFHKIRNFTKSKTPLNLMACSWGVKRLFLESAKPTMAGFNGTESSRSMSKETLLQQYNKFTRIESWSLSYTLCKRLLQFTALKASRELSLDTKIFTSQRKVDMRGKESYLHCRNDVSHQQYRPITVWLSRLLCLCAQRNTRLYYNKYVQYTIEMYYHRVWSFNAAQERREGW